MRLIVNFNLRRAKLNRFTRVVKGVGLVEGVVAIGILLVGLVAVVSLALSNNAASQIVTSRLVAINLAREGIEAARAIRDSNWLNGRTAPTGSANAWDTGLNSGSSDLTAIPVLNTNTLDWTMDFTTNSLAEASALVRRHDLRSLYVQAVGSNLPAQPYRRLLTIYSICHNPLLNQWDYSAVACSSGFVKAGLHVVSRVEWETKGLPQSIELEDWLFNWRYAFTPYVAP